ncbi:MAG: O-antigen ligase family protein [Ignavibacteriaceae bacterium]|nr:O-antigen ligase family protein [Ignavibacteriaceae bacterium]
MTSLLLTQRKNIVIGLLLSFLGILISKYIFVGIVVLLFLFLSLHFGEKFLLVFVISTFLLLTSTISPVLRAIVQVSNVLILAILFLRKYRLEFNLYPRIGFNLSLFFVGLFTAFFMSTVLSKYYMIGIPQIFRTIFFFIIIYLIFGLIDSKQNVKAILSALFFSAIVYFIFLAYELYVQNFDILKINLSDAGSVGNTYLHKNVLGSFFLIIISLLFGFLFDLNKRKIKWGMIFFIIVFSLGLFITNSRAAILSLFFSICLILFYLNKKMLWKTILSTSILIIIFIFSPLYESLNLYFRLERVASGRDFIFSGVWEVIKNNYLFGVGPAATKFELYRNIPFMLGSPEEAFILHHYNQIEFGHAHNFYLFFLSDLGLLGLIISIALPFIFLKISLSTIKKMKEYDRDYYYLSIGIAGSGFAMFLRGIFEWGGLISYGTINYDLSFWLIFAIIVFINSSYKIKTHEPHHL